MANTGRPLGHNILGEQAHIHTGNNLHLMSQNRSRDTAVQYPELATQISIRNKHQHFNTMNTSLMLHSTQLSDR